MQIIIDKSWYLHSMYINYLKIFSFFPYFLQFFVYLIQILQVRGIPKFKTKLFDMSANEGDLNIEFVVEIEGFPKPSVHWFLGDVEITETRTEYTRVEEGDNYKLIIKEVKTELKGRYTCKLQNEYGENSSSSNLTVNTRPKLLKKLTDQRMKEGDTLTLKFEVAGTPEPEVKWYKDGEEVSADARIKITRDSQRKESYDLTVTLLKGSDGGLYEVRAENELGYVTSKSKVIVMSKCPRIFHPRFSRFIPRIRFYTTYK